MKIIVFEWLSVSIFKAQLQTRRFDFWETSRLLLSRLTWMFTYQNRPKNDKSVLKAKSEPQKNLDKSLRKVFVPPAGIVKYQMLQMLHFKNFTCKSERSSRSENIVFSNFVNWAVFSFFLRRTSFALLCNDWGIKCWINLNLLSLIKTSKIIYANDRQINWDHGDLPTFYWTSWKWQG